MLYRENLTEQFGGRDFVYDSQGNKIVEDNGSYGARYKNSPLANEVIGDMNPDWKGGIRNSFNTKIYH